MRVDPSTDLGRTEGMYLVAAMIGIAVLAALCAATAIWIWWPR